MRPLLLFVLCSCSAVVSPDPDLLGGGDFDGGPGPDVPRIDAGPGNDSGPLPFDAGTDSATPPPVDAGPGCEGRPPRCEGNEFVTCVGGADVIEACLDGTMCNAEFGCQPFECPDSQPRCRNDVSLQCAGGPMFTSFPCDEGCDVATGLCIDSRFRPSNLGEDAFQDDAPDLIVPPDNFMFDTDGCSFEDMEGAATQAMNNGELACVWTLGTLEMPRMSSIRIFGELPLIIVASGDVSIEGTLDLRAEGNSPGAGGYFGGVRGEPNGSGESGGRVGQSVEPLADAGGGGGGGLSDGGRGGDAGDGDGAARGGLGGPAIMSMGEPLRGGSGGGLGQGSNGREGVGGGGGGAIQISALGTISFQGTIRATGGGGGGGRSASTNANWGAGGGGGAGGMILFEAPQVEMLGTLSVSGGGGGGGAASFSMGSTDGDDGPLSGSARGGQRGTQGGDGGGETPDDGDSSANDNGNGGGGGGSAGIIIIRGNDVVLEGNFNPDVAPIRRPI